MDGDLCLAALAGGLEVSSGNPPAVSEESHLEEMRSAIRGDFARLAERRGDQNLLRVADDPGEATEEPALEVTFEPEAEDRRSWLARFVSP